MSILAMLARATAVLAAAAAIAGAQQVTGMVLLPDSVTAASGAIVIASDARGAQVARALAAGDGHFSLVLPAAGAYSLRVLRIGFRPTEGPLVTVSAGEAQQVRLVVRGDAVSLAGVTVREQQTCRVSADTGLLVARVWEEARKTILATQLSTNDAPLVGEWVEYDRMLDSAARMVREQRVRSSTHPTTHAFRSLPAAELAEKGYVVSDNTGVTFYAPDADVLLSDTFINGHCFRLEEGPRDARTLIGVAFEPGRDRRDARDIEGTLWLDRATAELRSLDFRYTNLPRAAQSTGAGGRVEFLRLDDGNRLVSRWWVRMPRLGVSVASGDRALGRAVGPTTQTVVRSMQVTGGEVTRVTRHDTLVYALEGAHVAMQLTGRDSTLSLGGATVTLDGTDYRGHTDAAGSVRIGPVLPGRYVARVQSSLMDSLGMPAVAREVEAVTERRVDSIALPGAQELLARACPRDSIAHGEGMLRGTVRDTHARAVGAAAVVATWPSDVHIIGLATGDQLSYAEQTIGTLSDSAGAWRMCGVPRDRLLVVRVVADSGNDVRRTRLQPDQALGAVDLVLHQLTAAESGANAVAVEHRASSLPSALVELRATDLSGAPLPDVRLEIVPAKGPKRTVITAQTGHALVPDVAPGMLMVRARKIGYKEGQIAVTVDAGRNTVPIMLSTVSSPTLAAVRIVGGRSEMSRLDEFETRRLNHTASASFTREDIEKRDPVDAYQMLMNVPSLRFAVRDDKVVAISSRVYQAAVLNDLPCYIAVMVDGLVMNKDPNKLAFDLRMLPPPNDIYGMEVFAGPASIPLKYGLNGDGKWCGLIAIWTR